MSLIDQEVNLMNIKSGDYLDVGFHDVYIYSMEEGGEPERTPYIEITFKNENLQMHTARFYWTEKAMWRIKGLAVVCGVDPTDTAFKMRMLLDKWLTIELHKEEYDGKELTKLKNVHPCKKEGLKTDEWENDQPGTQAQEPPPKNFGQEKSDPF